MPVSREKVEGPATILAFLLEILLDMELRLPPDKLEVEDNCYMETQAKLHQAGAPYTNWCSSMHVKWSSMAEPFCSVVASSYFKGCGG